MRELVLVCVLAAAALLVAWPVRAERTEDASAVALLTPAHELEYGLGALSFVPPARGDSYRDAHARRSGGGGSSSSSHVPSLRCACTDGSCRCWSVGASRQLDTATPQALSSLSSPLTAAVHASAAPSEQPRIGQQQQQHQHQHQQQQQQQQRQPSGALESPLVEVSRLAAAEPRAPIVTVTSFQHWSQLMLDASAPRLVLFSSTWCGQSKRISDSFRARDCALPLHVVDCAVSKRVCAAENVSTWPVLRLYCGADESAACAERYVPLTEIDEVDRACDRVASVSLSAPRNATVVDCAFEVDQLRRTALLQAQLRMPLPLWAALRDGRVTTSLVAGAQMGAACARAWTRADQRWHELDATASSCAKRLLPWMTSVCPQSLHVLTGSTFAKLAYGGPTFVVALNSSAAVLGALSGSASQVRMALDALVTHPDLKSARIGLLDAHTYGLLAERAGCADARHGRLLNGECCTLLVDLEANFVSEPRWGLPSADSFVELLASFDNRKRAEDARTLTLPPTQLDGRRVRVLNPKIAGWRESARGEASSGVLSRVSDEAVVAAAALQAATSTGRERPVCAIGALTSAGIRELRSAADVAAFINATAAGCDVALFYCRRGCGMCSRMWSVLRMLAGRPGVPLLASVDCSAVPFPLCASVAQFPHLRAYAAEEPSLAYLYDGQSVLADVSAFLRHFRELEEAPGALSQREHDMMNRLEMLVSLVSAVAATT